MIVETSSRKRALAEIFRITVTYVYLALCSIRYLIAAIILNYQNDLLPNYFFYDPLLDMFLQLGLADRYLALVFWPAPLLLLFYDFLVSFCCYSCYRLCFELVVFNRQEMLQLNPQLLNMKIGLIKLLCNSQSLHKLKLKKWSQQHKCLPNVGPLDLAIRARAVVLATANDFLIAVVIIVLAAIAPFIIYFYSMTPVWGRFSPLKKLAITTDGLLALAIIGQGIIEALFFVLALNLIVSTLVAQLKVLNCRLNKVLIREREIKKKNLFNVKSNAKKRKGGHLSCPLTFFPPTSLTTFNCCGTSALPIRRWSAVFCSAHCSPCSPSTSTR